MPWLCMMLAPGADLRVQGYGFRPQGYGATCALSRVNANITASGIRLGENTSISTQEGIPMRLKQYRNLV